MRSETYYRDHWVEIDDERLSTYDSMFEWHPRMVPLIEGADVQPGVSVLDYGCGPGGMSMELARRVGPSGHITGLDLNSGMVALAKARAEREGFSASTKFLQWSEDRLPFDDATFERVICKSVLEYVADPSNVIEEFKRVTQPGGRVHIIDSDWSMMVLEPVGADKLRQLFNAASMAYNTPEIGRRLYGLMRHAGLTDVSVKVLCAADTTGVRAPVVRHMVSYAREANTINEAFLTAISKAVEDAIHDQTYLMILPQFVVSGIVPVAAT